ncbi:hypothetical protein Ssi03_66920 [Sphaerisporangium siamense]|nr:hypothetical protein Ssi03_66920 [Sphaerisporangium siamense]
MRGEQRLGVPAEAEVGVDEHGSGPVQRRRQQFEDTAQHHRDVTARLAVNSGMLVYMHDETPSCRHDRVGGPPGHGTCSRMRGLTYVFSPVLTPPW